jgi:hypothetical protein
MTSLFLCVYLSFLLSVLPPEKRQTDGRRLFPCKLVYNNASTKRYVTYRPIIRAKQQLGTIGTIGTITYASTATAVKYFSD